MRQDDRVGDSLGKRHSREIPLVQDLGHETRFGWSFPEIGGRRNGVIDAKWLKEYSEEIEEVQAEIKRQRKGVFREGENLAEKNERRATLYSVRQSGDAAEIIHARLKEGRTLSSDVQEHFHHAKSATYNEACMNDSGFEDISAPEMQRLRNGGVAEAKAFAEALNAPENESETRSATPQSEACYSMQSFASRDSGVYACDDASEFLQVASADRSYLDELGVLFGSHDACAEAKGHPGAGAGSSKYPLWFQRFSEEEDLTLHLGSLNWDSGLCLGESSAQPSISGGETDALGPQEESEDLCLSGAEETTDLQRRQRLRSLWSVCDRLEALSLHGRLSSGGVSEVMRLVEAFSRIDDRLQVLRYGLHSLTLQANESRNDLRSLENRASHLLASTAASRRRMAHLCALQRLEDRLQEEWWAAYNPNTVVLHENYIV